MRERVKQFYQLTGHKSPPFTSVASGLCRALGQRFGTYTIWAQLVLYLLVLLVPEVARAQSAVDGFDPGANADVMSIAIQADGRILVGGAFTTLGGGGAGTTIRNHIGRLNADGTLDTSFDPGANGNVIALTVQPDGKILVAGDFTTLGGGGTGTTTRNNIGRLNADGTLDTSFDPGANSSVVTVAVQADGKILLGGFFSALGGGIGNTTRNFIGRLNADGTLDTSFDPGASGPVQDLAVQTDNKILLGGFFDQLGGGGFGTVPRNHIGRLNVDGTLDTSFDPGASNFVKAIALQADGRILIVGGFTALGGGGIGTTNRNFIGRLDADGTLDASFNPGANSPVISLALQANGKVLVGGDFTTLGGGGAGNTARNFIGRLNTDGTLDTSFDPGTNNNSVFALVVQADGKILVGGNFTTLGGGGTGTTTRNRIGRLSADDTGNPVPGYEADVAPRPNGSNNGTVTIADWVQVGRFAAGLDTPNPGSEFQRADCSPKSTLGNGAISISDWVQAGRYAAGLDSVLPVGGPTAPLSLTAPQVGTEAVKTQGAVAAESAKAGKTNVTLVNTILSH